MCDMRENRRVCRGCGWLRAALVLIFGSMFGSRSRSMSRSKNEKREREKKNRQGAGAGASRISIWSMVWGFPDSCFVGCFKFKSIQDSSSSSNYETWNFTTQ